MRSLSVFIPVFCSLHFVLGCNNPSFSFNTVEKNPSADTSLHPQFRDSLNWFFDYLLLKDGRFSGGILVAQNGKILYERYTGSSDEGRHFPINAETPFHVASTSKTFTSIAILQQIEQGKLNLEDPVQRHFPLFPYPDIKVRHLITHSSGLPDYAGTLEKHGWDQRFVATNQDVMNLFNGHRPALNFKPGSKFKYCNTNFALLALLVEKLSGQLFPDYVQEHIFNLAGMSHSYVYGPYSKQKYMDSWNGIGRRYPFNFLDAIYGDKNVFTTCRDLLKYDSLINSGKLVKKETLEMAWEPYFADHRNRDTIEYYGLGWRLKIFNDSLKIAYHNGWWHGNNAVFQKVLPDQVVIIVTGNRFNRKIYDAGLAANIFRPYYLDEYKPQTEFSEANDRNVSPNVTLTDSTTSPLPAIPKQSPKRK